jgi:DNA recombination protein RmuC
MEIVYLIIGIAVGFALGFLFFKLKNSPETIGIDKNAYDSLLSEKNSLQNDKNQLQIEKGRLEGQANSIANELTTLKAQLETERKKNAELINDLATSKTGNENLLMRLNEQKQELEKLEDRFKTEFKNIANELLEDKSKRFTEQNNKNLNDILKPLSEKIQLFEKKVEEAYDKELRDKISLREEVRKLFDLNQKLSDEAHNLTKALKGDTKKQGNWGELILEKVLERSGLVKDVEYKTQFSTTNLEGSRIQPDVVVFLPDNKHIIIDSKVSLIAYNALVNTDTDEQRDKYILEHLLSVKNHIKGLSEKSYQSSADITAPDFVLLFMPIESSFSVAIQADNELFNYAWDRKIVMVSPSTLLATLRTIASIWKQERQTKNALEIARQSGALYDKFKGFVDDLIAVGKKMDDAKGAYSDAMNKLSSGSGNIVKRVEDLKKLGAKTEKALPQALVERSEEG